MTTQVCNHCHKEKPVAEFNWRWKALGIRQGACRDCQKKQKNEWYVRNQETERIRLRKQKADNRAAAQSYIWDYLSTHPCVDCGETDPVVLEFDHVRGKKRAPVSRLIANNASLDAIKKEIAKCEVRCSNCHRRKTYRERGGFRG